MTPLAQAATGLAVALGFALLCVRRTGGMATLCAAQAAVVALGALTQGELALAAMAVVEAGMLGWMALRVRGLLPLPQGEGEQTSSCPLRPALS